MKFVHFFVICLIYDRFQFQSQFIRICNCVLKVYTLLCHCTSLMDLSTLAYITRMSYRLRFSFKYLVFCLVLYECYLYLSGTAVAQWLRCCATNRQVAGSIPTRVSGSFIDIKLSYPTMALGSTQPLTEMSTRSISWE